MSALHPGEEWHTRRVPAVPLAQSDIRVGTVREQALLIDNHDLIRITTQL
eukprot:TRINITY_DN1315_c0_g1_i1.p2 TRINITY_DN1315_c0_g1~~TRINITY_DN1315_c0_g1_i1.p2  ORF type:complete len:50 (+),score=2.64 TRINITY_DN1315_c0_g1_i1:137-286(+)